MSHRPYRLEQFHGRLSRKLAASCRPVKEAPAEDVAALDHLIAHAPEGSELRRRLTLEREALRARSQLSDHGSPLTAVATLPLLLAQVVEINGAPGLSRFADHVSPITSTTPPPMPYLFYFLFVVALIAAGVALDRILFRPGQIYYLRKQRDHAIALLNGTSRPSRPAGVRTWWQRNTAPAQQWNEEVWD